MAVIGRSSRRNSRQSPRQSETEETSMVLLYWSLNGERHSERVPLGLARHRHAQLQTMGAVVYWSERLASMP
jgi:hypothetical protein